MYLAENWLREPYFECKKFVNLALVKRQKVTFEDVQTDEFISQSLHGNIDDVEYKKKKIEMHDIFSFTPKGKHNKDVKKVVIQGAPGIGKTLLARCICQKWAKGEILTEYQLVLFVPLRAFPANSRSLSLHDIVKLYICGPDVDDAVRELSKRSGEKVLLILEGWDELPPELRQEFTLFNDLLMGIKLSRASVMVTSKPIVVDELYRTVKDRQIEVLGFKEKQVKEYIGHNLKPEKAQEVWNYLECNPIIKAFAHVPLTLNIICEVVQELEELPLTETQLYREFVHHTTLRNLSKKQPSKLHMERELMEEVSSTIGPLSALSLAGFEQKRFVFTSDDLESVGLDPSLPSLGLGLLNAIPSYKEKGSMCSDHTMPLERDELYKRLYQFRHLTIQEYLASLHIATLDCTKQATLLKCYRHDKQFYNVWKFLAGITQLRGEICDAIVLETNEKDGKDVLLLCHCLYEAHNVESCRTAGEKLQYTVDLSNCCQRLSLTDCLCIAYVVASSNETWKIDLRCCQLGTRELEIFRAHFEDTKTQLRLAKLE